MLPHNILISSLFASVLLSSLAQGQSPPDKQASTLFPPAVIDAVRYNTTTSSSWRALSERAVAACEPWVKMSDDELWNLMFGPTINRSWMVWSDGHCAACAKNVPMYNWEMDALNHPWKTRCPHCKTLFPTNDFAAFYRSGLDEHGIFDPQRADRDLLFNVDHPDPADPLHRFGVDDGGGYVEGEKRWRFIGAYLIYGQWKQVVVSGIRRLAEAYVLTGEAQYAHKAGVLLDRVADVYPEFDFHKQGILYEKVFAHGYVTVWHDACEEVRELAIAYDQIFAGLKDDASLVEFLSAKARQYRLANPKASWADIQRNIEDRILRDALKQRAKILSNYPRSDIARVFIHMALGTPEHRRQADKIVDEVIAKGTEVDGVTGEKGLSGYATGGPRGIAAMLGQLSLNDPDWLAQVYQRHPRLHDCLRFHIDTWCLDQYYPTCGDASSFAARTSTYMGVNFTNEPLQASMYTFIYRMFKLTGDPAFAQILYLANGRKVEGLPYDMFIENPERIQKEIAGVVEREGPVPKRGSINKQQWHLAILRSGSGEHARAVWLDYDSGVQHAHFDGLNLGLFAYGLDLMPDFGYPPVQFGGWRSPRAVWYTLTAAHNTVTVDGKDQFADGVGRTELWADGQAIKAIKASEPGAYRIPVYERSVASIDISDREFYVFDVFRVVGGKDHAKFMGSHFSTITTQGIDPTEAVDYGHGTQLRNLRVDPNPAPGWSIDFKINDLRKYLDPPRDIYLRYIDLTEGAQAGVGEAWINAGIYDSTEDEWVPRVLTRRQSDQEGLASTFVSVIEPYEGRSRIAGVRKLALVDPQGKPMGEPHVAVEVLLLDGRKDVIILKDQESAHGKPVLVSDATVATSSPGRMQVQAGLSFIRLGSTGEPERIALCAAEGARIGNVNIRLKKTTDLIEVVFKDGRHQIVAGSADAIEKIEVER